MEISEFSLPPFPSISLYPNREQKHKTENFQRQLFHTTDESIYPPFINKYIYIYIYIYSHIKIESISKEHSFLHEKVNFSKKTNRPRLENGQTFKSRRFSQPFGTCKSRFVDVGPHVA